MMNKLEKLKIAFIKADLAYKKTYAAEEKASLAHEKTWIAKRKASDKWFDTHYDYQAECNRLKK